RLVAGSDQRGPLTHDGSKTLPDNSKRRPCPKLAGHGRFSSISRSAMIRHEPPRWNAPEMGTKVLSPRGGLGYRPGTPSRATRWRKARTRRTASFISEREISE